MINTMNDSATFTTMFTRKSSLRKEDRECHQDSSPAFATRSVSFAENDDGMETVHVRTIANREEYSKEEIRKMWYSEAEFSIMKLSIIHTLKKVLAGTYPHAIHAIESEVRGLEKKLPKESAKRKQKIFNSLYLVLEEQQRQRGQGSSDSEYIAELYRQSTAHCQAEAIKLAAIDYKVVKNEQKKTLQTVVQPPASPSSRTAMARNITSPLVKSRSQRRLLTMMLYK